MLVLTRKYMESLYIGDAIRVTVVRLDGGAVRLGIDAPKEVPVLRGELALRDRLEAAEEEPPAGPPLSRERRLRARGSDNRPRGPSQ